MMKAQHNKIHSLAAALLSVCVLLMSGCKKDAAPLNAGDERHVLLMMRSDDRTYADALGSENNIIEINAYAYDSESGELLGKQYVSSGSEAPFAEENTSFLMDIKVKSTTTQKIDIYAIANVSQIGAESADEIHLPPELDPTREYLQNLSFVSLTYRDRRRGLPMSCVLKDVVLDVSDANDSDASESGAINKVDHQGHYVVNEDIRLSFQRCVSKIEIYAAKSVGEDAKLTIKHVSLSNHKQKAYVFPQSPLPAENTEAPIDILKLDEGMLINAALEAESDVDKVEKYNEVMGTPYYIFETVGGSTDWTKPNVGAVGDAIDRGAWIDVTYQFEGSDPRTGRAYLPKIERNSNYQILCQFTNTGAITIDYKVQPWDEVVWKDIDFKYPTSENPVKLWDPVDPVTTPEIYYDAEQKKGYVDFRFKLTYPEGMTFTPVLYGSSEDYMIKVFTEEGEEIENLQAGCVASEAPYRIRVIALTDVESERTVNFAITHWADWINTQSFLFINGGEGGDPTYYPGSTSAEYIPIKHIPAPTGNAELQPGTDEPVQ